MSYVLGAFGAKILSLVGIGSAISGLFIKKKIILLSIILVLSILDTSILCSIKTVCNFQASFILAIAAGLTSGFVFHFIKNKLKKNEG